ncbi:MAG: hypothetical protein GY934_15525 [Gammaproteobacteria bacterium]|nr:hypothetical protein [Gammaproteobacteria bacterium]
MKKTRKNEYIYSMPSLLFGLLLLLILPQAWGASPFERLEGADRMVNPNVEEYVWEEEEAGLPPYPQEQDYIPAGIDIANGRFDFFLDANHIAYGEDDGVIRYTLKIVSKSGSSQVMHEGLRCSTVEYKTYAFGDRRGQFKAVKKPKWRKINTSKTMRYHYDLWGSILCNKTYMKPLEKIIRDLKYPSSELYDQSEF